MKKTLVTLAVCALIAPAAFAQTMQLSDLIAMSRSQIEADRQSIVAQSLGLTPEQSKAFWPMYKQYRADVSKPLDRAWTLFQKYGERWQSMTDADASSALNEWLDVEKDIVGVKQKWAKRFSKDVGGVTTARFFQIDNKLDTILRLEAASEIPLVEKKQ